MKEKSAEKYCLIFSTVYFALKAEKAFQEKGLDFQLIPIPRELSSSCGMAVLFSCYDEPIVKNILSQANIEHEGYYHFSEKNFSWWQTFFG